jgi:N,N-dimethylformamidase
VTRRLVAYADRLSAHPGERLKFMVNALGGGDYRADIVRLRCGDLDPNGPGFKETVVDSPVAGSYKGRRQEIKAGSCAIVDDDPRLAALSSFTLAAFIWPTTPARDRQAIVGKWCDIQRRGFALAIDEGEATLLLGDEKGQVDRIGSGTALHPRQWYFVAATFDAETGIARLIQRPLDPMLGEPIDVARLAATGRIDGNNGVPLSMAAFLAKGTRPIARYNGKIDRPRLASAALDDAAIEALAGASVPQPLRDVVVGAWDLGDGIRTDCIRDRSDARFDGRLLNLPARGMKGHNWDGSAHDWKAAPEQYGAVHFHEDDIYDAGWDVDFELEIPASMKSGVYCARLTQGDEIERVPFFVRPPKGKATADTLFLVPSCSYLAYANEISSMPSGGIEHGFGHVPAYGPEDIFLWTHPEYGLSFYDTHIDGSGVCYSSRLRPILNMRPGHTTAWVGIGGSTPWQFNADTHIVDWLEAKGIEYDVATDEDLHNEGIALLQRYKSVVTGSHPEYWSTPMHDALGAWISDGGRFAYLGANGFYWRVAFHDTLPGVIELRRTEDGVRDWEAEAGEYYMSFTGEYGGLWRRNGRPPQSLVGVGFVAQGFDVSSYYEFQRDAVDPRVAFIMQGIDPGKRLGDFGSVGGGAAGLELDWVDAKLGTPWHTLRIASSLEHSNAILLVPEEINSATPAMSGRDNANVRADITFFETPGGGAVFSTGSISWAGSLAHNNYDNNVSRMTENVLRRFVDPKPFRMPAE